MKTVRTHNPTLSEFKRNSGKFLQKLKETGAPLVLSVNGSSAIVVQDAQSYQRMLDEVDRLETIEGIRKGLEDVEQGRTQPAAEACAEIRRKFKLRRNA